MTVENYRDAISGLSDVSSSLRSAATDAEITAESARLERELAAFELLRQPSRLSDRDRSKAARVVANARQSVCNALMYLFDNQRIEAEYTS